MLKNPLFKPYKQKGHPEGVFFAVVGVMCPSHTRP